MSTYKWAVRPPETHELISEIERHINHRVQTALVDHQQGRFLVYITPWPDLSEQAWHQVKDQGMVGTTETDALRKLLHSVAVDHCGRYLQEWTTVGRWYTRADLKDNLFNTDPELAPWFTGIGAPVPDGADTLVDDIITEATTRYPQWLTPGRHGDQTVYVRR